MRAVRVVFILWLALVAWHPSHASAEKRVALVIGVGHYKNVPALANPPNDARVMGAALEKLDFDVRTVVDPDYETFKRALRDFGTRLDGATVAMFFYAGHGLQVGGRNYLLPTDAALARETDLRYETFDVQAVLEQMDYPGRVNLVFLDACRDNPMSRSLAFTAGRSAALIRGLAPIETAAGGTLIAFATAPGDVSLDGRGKNSPFTESLARHIATPDLDVRQMLTRVRNDVQAETGGRQRPWVNESLDSDFYFVPRSVPAPGAQPSVPQSTEIIFWQSIASSRNAADYEAYLQQYPQGAFAALARIRVAELSAKPQPAAPIATAPAATPSPADPAVRDALAALGFHPPSGGEPAAAIRLWQAFQAADDTGHLTAEQRDQLVGQSARLASVLTVAETSPRGTSSATVRSAAARFALGVRFETGAVRDANEAAYWYTLAAHDDWAAAYTNLGTLRARQQPPDIAAARLLWLAAAARGEATALFNLGALAEHGLGEPADPAAAKRWYSRGAALKNGPSIAALKRLGE